MTELAEPTLCYLCCGTLPTKPTRDHVVPKQLFDSSNLPPNLYTLPSCLVCNNGLSRDEEYFRIHVLATAYGQSNTATSIWDGAVRRSLTRSKGFRRMLAQNVQPVRPAIPFFSPSGQFVGDGSALMIEGKRTGRVLRKLVRGLYWRHVGSLLPADADFLWHYFDPKIRYEPDVALPQFWRLAEEASFGDVLRYWWVVAKDDPRGSIWWFEFYGAPVFMVVTDAIDTDQLSAADGEAATGT